MYFSKKTHLLSFAIMTAAVIKLAGAATEGIIRMMFARMPALLPDMLDTLMWRVQVISSVVQVALIAVIFFMSWRKLSRYRELIDEDDRAELGMLQKEVLGEHLSSLTANEIGQLIQIWAVILIGAECIYFFASMIYRRFTKELVLMAINGAEYDSFVSLYNMTHGFKYIEMMTAILLGVVMTAIFLSDRYLKIAAVVISIAFLLAFGVFQMQTIGFSGREIGIVWSSVIFHLTETIGLFMLAVYLSRHYIGL